MGRKRALLIGVADYDPAGGFTKLKAPLNDIRLLRTVLEDPKLGNFDSVTSCDNPDRKTLELAIEQFFRTADADDLCLLYFSGHGKFPQEAEDAHLAAVDTHQDWMQSTGTSAGFVRRQLATAICESKVVILDCCTSGAFAKDILSKSGVNQPKITERHFGKGTWVLSASSAFKNAYERPTDTGSSSDYVSYFTEAIVHGIRTGAADVDGDGRVTVGELFNYANKRVLKETRSSVGVRQKPTLSRVASDGELLLAANPSPPPVEEMLSVRTGASKKMARALISVTAAVAVIATAATVAALNWPGASKKSPSSPPTSSNTPVKMRSWKRDTGTSVGPCAAQSGSIYCVGHSEEKLYAFNADNGKMKWEYELDGRPSVEGVPLLAEGAVYIGVSVPKVETSRIHAIDAASGKRRWVRPLGRLALEASATYSDGMIFTSDASNAYGISSKTGRIAWKRQIGGGNMAAPVTDGGGFLYVASGDGTMYALDSSDGAVRWKKKVTGGVPTTAAIANGDVYVGASNALGNGKIHALDSTTGAQKWSYSLGEVEDTPIVVGDLLYTRTEDGKVYAISTQTHKPKWVYQSGKGFGPRLTFSAESLYVSGDDRTVRAIDFQSGKEKWTFRAAEAADLPTVWDGTVFFGASGTLYAVNASDGKLR
ncbi:outer membrane protein assembly factor BamB [Streptomyces sp. V4I23]|uniref:caspase, EACC1-associated type n=1 Tax=Streptomyces sp. V4I23 TaxID=3042282 RepID=UPI002782E11A|nr:PQQ-binding-like beta-propeller repeat protein [Streptomyces sp. V4I23]MDQ1010700.1 outer membrane protein assembly factor BamB [Streptomyces sp. V4I23]